MAFAKFMLESTGRAIWAVAGFALIAIGSLVGETVGLIMGLAGLMPLAAGVFNFCIIEALVGECFSGVKNLKGWTSETLSGDRVGF